MNPSSRRRLVGAAAALMLIGATLLSSAGSAMAATGSTRLVYVGSDPGFSLGNGTITFTPVSAGQQTASAVYVKNIDNQTLNHVVLTFPRDQGNGVTIDGTVFGTDAASCPTSVSNITCDFGQMRAKATHSFTLVLTASSATSPTTPNIHGTIVYNESTNPNGGNPQINDITGTLNVAAASCNSLAAFLPPGQAKSFLPSDGTTCGSDGQRSGLGVPSNGNGNVIAIDDSVLANPNDCGSFTCFGYVVSASVNNGAPNSPYLLWQIFYSNDILGNINPKQVGFLHGTTPIAAGNKGLCKNASSLDCQEPYVVSATGVTFYIRTLTNLVMKGHS